MKKTSSSRRKIRKIALMGIFMAEALALSFLENLLPQFIPLPASRAGLSNIITMFAVSSYGFSSGFYITLFKAFFALITRGSTAFFLSLSGGILSLLIMTVLFKINEEKISCVFIGAVSSLFHNAGQLICAYFVLGKYVLSLTPYLIISALATGILTGVIFKYTASVFIKQQNSIIHSQDKEQIL